MATLARELSMLFWNIRFWQHGNDREPLAW
jgi:hypothetical protein